MRKKPATRCPRLATGGKHTRIRQYGTGACEHKWQYQYICECGFVWDDGAVYGTPPPDWKETPTEPENIDLTQPSDIDRLVQVLFDSNLRWVDAVRQLNPKLSIKDARALADQWANDERVKAAIDSYVQSLNPSEVRLAVLLHQADNILADKDESGAVRATALNIKKAAYVTEKSIQQQHGRVLIEGLEAGLKRKFGSDETTQPAPDMVN